MANRQEIEAEFQRRMAEDKASGGKNQARFMQAYQSFQNMPDDDLTGLFPVQQQQQTQPQALSANTGQVQTSPEQTTQENKINQLIEKALGKSLERKETPEWQQVLTNALAGAAGREFPFKFQADHGDMATKALEIQHKRAQIEALKNRASNPNYVLTYDELGNPVYMEAPRGRIIQQTAGLTPEALDARRAQAESARAGIPLKEAQTKIAGKQSQVLEQFLPDEADSQISGIEGNIPPGTTMSAGGLKIPLNPKLTESEQGVIAGFQSLNPIVNDITALIDEGVLGEEQGNLIQQFRADRPSALFTRGDEKLQRLQSNLNTLKKTIPFTEGGKQLTITEKEMVMALLNTIGKSPAQIKVDISRAMDILRAKERLALGGAMAVKQTTQITQPPSAGTRQIGRFIVEES